LELELHCEQVPCEKRFFLLFLFAVFDNRQVSLLEIRELQVLIKNFLEKIKSLILKNKFSWYFSFVGNKK
jgi:hypothetical protein